MNLPEELPLVTYGSHPLRMKAVFEINYDFLTSVTGADQLAAFVNGECRGKGRFVERNGKKLFEVDINGSLGTTEKVSIKYYNAARKCQYESVSTFDFVAESTFGSIAAPELIELNVIEN